MNVKLITRGLSWLAVAGVALTSFLSAKCSKKAEHASDAKGKVKAYAPAIVSGVGTCACILTANHISGKAIAGLAATCTYMTANRDKIQQKLVDIAGKDDASEIKTEVNKESAAPWEGPSIEWTGKGTLKVIDGYSGRMFYSSLEAVQEAEDCLNELFTSGEAVSYNDFFRLLGIAITYFGDQYGWNPVFENYEGPIEFINTMTKDENGEDMLVIDIFSTSFPMDSWKGDRRSE